MGKLLMIGRWVKGKGSVIVDLKTYRDMKKRKNILNQANQKNQKNQTNQNNQNKEAKDGKVSKGTEEKGEA